MYSKPFLFPWLPHPNGNEFFLNARHADEILTQPQRSHHRARLLEVDLVVQRITDWRAHTYGVEALAAHTSLRRVQLDPLSRPVIRLVAVEVSNRIEIGDIADEFLRLVDEAQQKLVLLPSAVRVIQCLDSGGLNRHHERLAAEI